LETIVHNDGEMQELGKAIAGVLEINDVVYIVGDLGVGKTTLTRGIARGLGYKGRVNSPTFTIMNVYEIVPVIYHFDFYRLEGADMFDLGLEDYLGREGISIIEWPQAGETILPEEALIININLIDDDYEQGRTVKILARGEQYLQKIEELKKIVGVSS